MKKIISNIRGSGIVEYGAVAGLVSVIAIGSVLSFGEKTDATFDGATTQVADARASVAGGSGEAITDGGTTTPEEPTDEGTTTPEEPTDGAGDTWEEPVVSPVPSDSWCYDPSYVGVVGEPGSVCGGMLIVDLTMMHMVASPAVGGDGTFALLKDGTYYTFEDDAHNIFTGQVKYFGKMFESTSYNGDIGYWDTSNALEMHWMFMGNSAFNQDLSTWDVSNVQYMNGMFGYASAFNSPLNDWDVSSVTDMSHMFGGADAFNQPLDTWKTGAATNMDYMFNDADSFAQDLSMWCVSQIAAFPQNFDANTPAWGAGPDGRPVWGTCPTP
ncbi:BspA family leucine-rich repeat surface protein [Tranquillimonas alkanivorans]|uniref:Surface protein n=1 Tax=Tranquillimonas alkanivorans TaxID=441119 RepID=A0A1I5WBJ2_9RHOB|nr:BspA family leucine-rich repeat surface protein [Tranquillimonas alkanivorans]SFQ17061.1 surface protein [Tranquillimonas alkanivorans]